MARSTGDPSTLTQERIERLDALLHDLKDDARKCYEEGDTFLLGVYEQLLAVVSPIVVKAHARAQREHLAATRKGLKTLRKADRQAHTA